MTALNGPTRFFFDDPTTDRLLAMVLSLGAETAALREELDTLRALLAEKTLVSAEDIAAYQPSSEAQAEQDRARERLVANLLFPLQQACEAAVEEARSTRGRP